MYISGAAKWHFALSVLKLELFEEHQHHLEALKTIFQAFEELLVRMRGSGTFCFPFCALSCSVRSCGPPLSPFPDKQGRKKKHRLDRKDGDDGHLWLQLWPHRHIFERLDDKLLECPAVSQSGSKTWLTAVEHNRNVILIWAVGTAALAWEIIQALIAEADPNSEGSNQTHTLVHTVKQIGTINGSLRSNTLDLWVSVELSYHNRRYVCVNFTLWSHMPG